MEIFSVVDAAPISNHRQGIVYQERYQKSGNNHMIKRKRNIRH